jgi:hypothetical protein
LFAIPGVTFWIEPFFLLFFEILIAAARICGGSFCGGVGGRGGVDFRAKEIAPGKFIQFNAPSDFFAGFHSSHSTLLDRETALQKKLAAMDTNLSQAIKQYGTAMSSMDAMIEMRTTRRLSFGELDRRIDQSILFHQFSKKKESNKVRAY